MQVALRARDYISLVFPRILEPFGLTAFSFLAVLESAKSSCPSLPGALVQHLLDVE